MSNRREFFKRASQLLMLSGLIGGAAWLVTRNGVSDSCDNSDLCKNCSKLKNCDLEKAEKYKAGSK